MFGAEGHAQRSGGRFVWLCRFAGELRAALAFAGHILHAAPVILQAPEVIEVHVKVVDHPVAVLIIEGLHIIVNVSGDGANLVGRDLVPFAEGFPDAQDLGALFVAVPAGELPHEVVLGAAADLFPVRVGELVEGLENFGGGFLHRHQKFLAHARIFRAHAEFIVGVVGLDVAADIGGDVFQAAGGVVVAARPAVRGIEFAADALGGLVGHRGFAAVVAAELEHRKEPVKLGVDLLHGGGIAAHVGVMELCKALVFALQLVEGFDALKIGFHCGNLLNSLSWSLGMAESYCMHHESVKRAKLNLAGLHSCRSSFLCVLSCCKHHAFCYNK